MKHSFLMTICLFCFCSIFGQETIPLKDALSLTKCKISEYASSIEYIPLETSDDCLIGDEFSLIVASQDIFGSKGGSKTYAGIPCPHRLR